MRKGNVEDFNKKLENKNIPYILIGEYITNKTKTLFYCVKHENNFESRPDNILNGHIGCELCEREKRKQLFLDNLKSLNTHYELVGEYIDLKTETTFYCSKHKNYFQTTPDSILKGQQSCQYCSGRTYWDLITLNEHLKNKKLMFHEFVTTKVRTKCECLECGYIWEVKPEEILRGRKCNKCFRVRWDLETLNEFLSNRKLKFKVFKSVKKHHPCECLECGFGKNGKWKPKPNSILNGNGCPNCANSSFNTNKSAVLYYIKFEKIIILIIKSE